MSAPTRRSPDWTSGRIEDGGRATAWSAVAIALVWNLIAWPAAVVRRTRFGTSVLRLATVPGVIGRSRRPRCRRHCRIGVRPIRPSS